MSIHLHRLRNVVVTLAHALITANLGIFALLLLHEGLELGIITLGNGLGLHLDRQIAAGGLNGFANVDNGLLQALNTNSLVQAGAGQNVQGWRDELNLDLGLLCVARLGSAQGRLYGVDTLIAEASNLNIGTDLGWLRGKALANVRLELVCDRLAGEGNVLPDLGVADDWLSIQWL